MNYNYELQEAICKRNYTECVEIIINSQDDTIVNTEYNKKCPLCLACEHDSYEIVELLVKVI